MREVSSPGKPVVRVDTYAKATGKSVYPSDMVLEDMLLVRILHTLPSSPHVSSQCFVAPTRNVTPFNDFIPPFGVKYSKGNYSPKFNCLIGGEIYLIVNRGYL